MEAQTDYKASGFVDEGRAVGVIYFSFSKVFNTVSPNILIFKLGVAVWMTGQQVKLKELVGWSGSVDCG